MIKRILTNIMSVALLMSSSVVLACTEPASVCNQSANGSFALIKQSKPATIIVDANADPALQRVAKSFAADLKLVSGHKTKIKNKITNRNKTVVVIGVLGESPLIDKLINSRKLNVNGLADQWEGYQLTVVNNPWPKVKQALVIVGSDRRGAVFGTYELSAQMGVSPWYWFADAPVKQKKNVYVTAGTQSDKPKVRYRGIFINDEDPALSGWAKKQFGGLNASMYEHVFELILRLKGNYIWPAMWGKAFHLDDPKNTILADEMGIVVGASHHEPMHRAHAEWHSFPNDPTTGGAWNYETNKDNLSKFWRGGIERMMAKGDDKGYESLITLGMRGDGDEPMSEGTAIKLLEDIVAGQRSIIENVTKKPAAKTPQVWALYKEVQDYYDQGMTVPDDVTLLFADDNWGQIRRLPTKDLDRKGGFGVYYHFDYVGVPRNYKWLNTVQVEKVWQQMNLAYERGAKDIWVVNVGDIKPIEYPIDFFMEMAWDPEKMTPAALTKFPEKWATEVFSKKLASDIGDLMTRYSQLAAYRKPELINQDTYSIGSHTNKVLHGGEFGEIMAKWRALSADLATVKSEITKAQYPAFYQLIEWPIAAVANLHELYYAAAWNRRLSNSYDARANYFHDIVEQTFAYDRELTNKYHQLKDGKWDGMVNQVHMNYHSWNTPTYQTIPSIVRVNGGANNIDVVFAKDNSQQGKQTIIEASDFTRNNAGKNVAWKRIDNLGMSKAAMIAYPQGQPSSTIKDNVSLEYDFTTQNKGDISVVVQLSPTLNTVDNGKFYLAVSVDGNTEQLLAIDLTATGGAPNTPAKQNWFKAAADNRVTLNTSFSQLDAGKHTLKVIRLDDNVILEKLMINEQ